MKGDTPVWVIVLLAGIIVMIALFVYFGILRGKSDREQCKADLLAICKTFNTQEFSKVPKTCVAHYPYFRNCLTDLTDDQCQKACEQLIGETT